MSRADLRLRVADTACLALALAIAVSPLTDVWADRTWMVTVAVGLLLAVGTTLVAERYRLGPVLTGLLVALGYLVVAPAAAAPSQTVGGVVPTPDAARTVVVGLVESWRSVITLPLPLGVDRGELVVPFVIALGAGVLATTFLWRTRFPGLAHLTVAAAFLAAAAFGSSEAALPLARGLLLVVVLVLWNRWRSLRTLRTSWVRRVAMGAAVVTVAGLAGWGLATATAGPEREVLRDHVEPPLAELDLKSPLARYRHYYKAHKTDVLFRFDNVPAGDPHVRLATMDSFDGLVWNVTTSDLASGTSAYRPAPSAQGGGSLRVTSEEYTGTWVPSVGTATAATLDSDAAPDVPRELLLNTATGGVAMSGEVRPGDEFLVDWAPRPERTNALLSRDADRSVLVPESSSPPIEKLDQLAQQWVGQSGASSDFQRAVALEQGFRDNGYFNDGEDPERFGFSASGHGTKRLADLVQDEKRMVGNDEQYASAMAYAAQRLGLPARVALGFEEISGTGTVTGDDIAAWVEIAFADHGWVPFDPTPPEDRTPPPLDEKNNPVPQPYVVQPPVIPEEPEDVQGVPPEGAGKDLADELWDWLFDLLGYLWILLQVLLLLSPLWLIVLIKRIRRRRRRKAADPLVRLSGGWREITDRAKDLGTTIPVGHTRSENCAVLVGRFGESAPTDLAVTADRHTFGPGTLSEEEVAAYWEDVGTALKRMRREVPRWRRWWAVLSPASLPWREAGRAVRRAPRRWTSAVVGRLGGLARRGGRD
ncbi:transglutaminase-like domain-containing protein [Nocardioides panacisoli]|uniref:transglutaminase-like domain-containing protein n=1 Tax=Nocardioides panacisoli TaxID=627624 RepID=UPI001C62BDCF|nr:transglutaminase-like domain-containing protein [Nocardioides panacisoli]QYJ05597.1 transglutaminase-like domain-containing protein [Nocardioides panacisoli]